MKILQKSLPYDALTPRALPGIQPMELETWLHQDEAFAGQMERRDQLIAERPQDVLALSDEALAAADELLSMVLETAYPSAVDFVERADGVTVAIDRKNPMATLGRIVQEDFCILQKQGDEHVLTAAVLCFPASWTLREKFLRPLVAIHVPVESYDDNIARRVQRLFDGVRVGRPLWRFNALWYSNPELYQPRRGDDRRIAPDQEVAAFFRSERQSILRLPQSEAIVFTIHTYILAQEDVIGNDQNPA